MAKVLLGDILTESKVESLQPNPSRRITVRLNVKGVEKRPVKSDTKGATKYYIRRYNQFIYGKQNLFKGAFGIIPKELDGYETSSDLPCFDIDTKRCKPEWIYYFLKKGNFYKSLEKIARGAGSKRVSPKDLFNIYIPLPSLNEQEKILNNVKLLEKENEQLAEEIQTQQILLKKLRQAILQEAIEGKLTKEWREQNQDVESASMLLEKIKAEKEQLVKEKKIRKQKPLPPISEEDIPFEIPESWVWCRLNTLVSVLGDGLHGTPHYKEHQKCYFINGNNLSNGKIIFKDSTKTVPDVEYEKYKKPLSDRTILVSINGTLGNVAFYNNEYIILGKSACYFNLLNFINKAYIKSIIESQYFLEYAVRMSSKTTINNLSLKNMNLLPVPLPPLQEQKEIVKKIKNLFAVCDELEAQIESSKANSEMLMQAALKEAFEG